MTLDEELRKVAKEYRRALYDPENENKFGSLAYQWKDKPHRSIYDLCKMLEKAANKIQRQRESCKSMKKALIKEK